MKNPSTNRLSPFIKGYPSLTQETPMKEPDWSFKVIGDRKMGEKSRDRWSLHVPPERQWSKRMGEILRGMGLFTYQTAEKLYHGIPDRYVSGGNFIELKKIPPAKAYRRLHWSRHFTSKQRRALDAATEGGDRAWIFIIWQIVSGNDELVRLTLAPWPEWRDTPTRLADNMDEYSSPSTDFDKLVKDNFGPQFERNSRWP